MMEVFMFIVKILFATLMYLTAIQLCIKLHNYLKKKKSVEKEGGKER